jgi:hypothetical protein
MNNFRDNKTIVLTILILLFIISSSITSSESIKTISQISSDIQPNIIEKNDTTCAGYTLFSVPTPRAASDQHAILIDMNGTIIHEWTITGFPAKMLPGGSLIGSATSRGILHQENIDLVQESWNGDFEWEFSNWDDDNTGENMARQHHDFQREGNPVGYFSPGQEFVSNGTTLILAHYNEYDKNISHMKLKDDVIYEVDWNGNLTGFEWHATDHFDEMEFDILSKIGIYFFPGFNIFLIFQTLPTDWFHLNSISLLGQNRWYEEGDQRFHPDNIIICSRLTNILAIIDRQTGDIVWKVGPNYNIFTKEGRDLGKIIGPHHAHIIPKGLPGEGNILVFDNGGITGYGPFGVYRYMRFYTRIIEFDPITFDIIWEYTDNNFYCNVMGAAQRLPNGNTLITNSVDGEILEVNSDKEIVWSYQSESKDILGKKWVYRAYRIPPEWVPGNPSGYDYWE